MTSKTKESSPAGVLPGVSLALLAFALFALHDALIKSITNIHVFQSVFFVVLFSFVPFVFMLAVDGQEKSLRPQLPGMVALRCLFTTGALLSAFYAFGSLPITQVYPLLFSAPVLITLLSIPLLGERVKLIRWIAIFLGMAGIVVVLRPGTESLSAGHLSGLVAALFIACTAVVTRKIGDREHSVVLILYPMLGNVVVSGVLLIFVYQPMPADALLKAAAVGMLSVSAQMLMIRAYRQTEAQFVAPMQYSQMLWAVFYGVWVFDEALDRYVVLGALIIVFSGFLFIWRELTASVKQPVLRTRNVRMAGGPQVASSESDQSE